MDTATHSAPTATIDELELLRLMLAEHGTIILRNGIGTMELRGTDLTLKTSDQWLTIYHASAPHSEHRSHIHMRRGRLSFACVIERENGTPQMTFWEREADAAAAIAGDKDSKPPFAIFFASFFDWQAEGGPRALPENQTRYQDWVRAHGKRFELTT